MNNLPEIDFESKKEQLIQFLELSLEKGEMTDIAIYRKVLYLEELKKDQIASLPEAGYFAMVKLAALGLTVLGCRRVELRELEKSLKGKL